jgi:hypothetical protein
MGQSGTTVARPPGALVEAIEQLTRALAQIAALPATPLLRREQIKHQVVSGARAIGQSQERSKTPLLFRVPPLSLPRGKGRITQSYDAFRSPFLQAFGPHRASVPRTWRRV